jgi:hypothetical protein
MTKRYYKNNKNKKMTKKKYQKGGSNSSVQNNNTEPTINSTSNPINNSTSNPINNSTNTALTTNNNENTVMLEAANKQVNQVNESLEQIDNQAKELENLTNLEPNIPLDQLKQRLAVIDEANTKLHSTLDVFDKKISEAEDNAKKVVTQSLDEIGDEVSSTAGEVAAQVAQGALSAIPVVSLSQTVRNASNAVNMMFDTYNKVEHKVELVTELMGTTQKILNDFERLNDRVAKLYEKVGDTAANAAGTVAQNLTQKAVNIGENAESQVMNNVTSPQVSGSQVSGSQVSGSQVSSQQVSNQQGGGKKRLSHSIRSRIKNSIDSFLYSTNNDTNMDSDNVVNILKRMNKSIEEFYYI